MNILIFDDDIQFVEKLTSTLVDEGHVVFHSLEEKTVYDFLKEKEIDQVILSKEISNLDIEDFLFESKSYDEELKFILTTVESVLNDFQYWLDLGCRAILTKPISKNEILMAIKYDYQKGKELINEGNHIRIKIEDFICGKKLSFPVYLKIGKDRFIKLAHSGMEVDLDQLGRLKSKGITDLWIHSSNLERYLKITEAVASSKASWTPETRAQIFRHLSEITYEHLRLFGLGRMTISAGIDSMKSMVDHLEKTKESQNLISNMLNNPNKIAATATVGSALSALVCQVIGWNSAKTLSSITIGAFFRDLFLTQVECEGLYPINPQHWYAHPKKSAEMIRFIPSLPNDVFLIIEQHHEDGSPKAFPVGIHSLSIYSLAKIVNVVDCFLTFIFTSEEPSQTEKIKKALNQLHSKYPKNNIVIALECLLRGADFNATKRLYHHNQIKSKQAF